MTDAPTTRIVRAREREWARYEIGVRFAADHVPLGRALSLDELGCSLWRIPPDRATTPFHVHHVNEEMAWVVDGTPTVRLTTGEHELGAGDIVAFPAGPDSAHQFLNRSDEPATLILASTMLAGDVADYPDTGRRLYMRSQSGLSELDALIDDGRVVPLAGVEDLWTAEAIDEPLGPAPGPPSVRDGRIAALVDLAWESYATGPFRGERKRPARAVGAERLGCSLYRIEPGDRMWPYHLHHVNEEVFVVVSGEGRARTSVGEEAIGPGDAIGCPTGPGGAHAIRAAGDEPLEVLALSTMKEPEVIEYPDSTKINVMVGAPPGGEKRARAIDHVFRLADAVEYYAERE